jgi:hypothetical protein
MVSRVPSHHLSEQSLIPLILSIVAISRVDSWNGSKSISSHVSCMEYAMENNRFIANLESVITCFT